MLPKLLFRFFPKKNWVRLLTLYTYLWWITLVPGVFPHLLAPLLDGTLLCFSCRHYLGHFIFLYKTHHCRKSFTVHSTSFTLKAFSDQAMPIVEDSPLLPCNQVRSFSQFRRDCTVFITSYRSSPRGAITSPFQRVYPRVNLNPWSLLAAYPLFFCLLSVN